MIGSFAKWRRRCEGDQVSRSRIDCPIPANSFYPPTTDSWAGKVLPRIFKNICNIDDAMCVSLSKYVGQQYSKSLECFLAFPVIALATLGKTAFISSG